MNFVLFCICMMTGKLTWFSDQALQAGRQMVSKEGKILLISVGENKLQFLIADSFVSPQFFHRRLHWLLKPNQTPSANKDINLNMQPNKVIYTVLYSPNLAASLQFWLIPLVRGKTLLVPLPPWNCYCLNVLLTLAGYYKWRRQVILA